MLLDHVQTAPRPVSEITELDVPPELERLILWCLEKVGIIWDVKRAPEEVKRGRLANRSWLIEDEEPATSSTVPTPA